MLDKLIVGLTTNPQARADAREGLGEMGRGIFTLLKWGAIGSAALLALGVLVVVALIYNDWAKAHEATIRWAMLGGAVGYGLWLLSEIRDRLGRIVALLESRSLN